MMHLNDKGEPCNCHFGKHQPVLRTAGWFGGDYDILTCPHDRSLMNEPQLGNKGWYNVCPNCGMHRNIPSNHPLLINWKEGLESYPETLKELSRPEPWTWHITKTANEDDFFDEYYYHRAPTQDRARILQHGLQPSNPMINPYWRDPRDDRQLLYGQPTGVYLAPRMKDTMGGGPKADIWRVDPAYINEQREDPSFPSTDMIVVPHSIPPEALHLHKPYEDKLNPERWEELASQRPQEGWELPKEWGVGRPDRVIGSAGDSDSSEKQILPPKEGMAMDPDFYNKWIAERGPYLYHNTDPYNIPSILNHGLFPWDHPSNPVGTQYPPESTIAVPRPGHVYLRAQRRVPPFDQPQGDEVRIDIRHLDPSLFNPDEDLLYKEPHLRAEHGIPPETNEFHEWEGLPWTNRGGWAEFYNFSHPHLTAESLNQMYGIAYKGIIPSEAIDYPRDPEWAAHHRQGRVKTAAFPIGKPGWYHFAPIEAREAIEQEGLQPRDPKYKEGEPGVYLWQGKYVPDHSNPYADLWYMGLDDLPEYPHDDPNSGYGRWMKGTGYVKAPITTAQLISKGDELPIEAWDKRFKTYNRKTREWEPTNDPWQRSPTKTAASSEDLAPWFQRERERHFPPDHREERKIREEEQNAQPYGYYHVAPTSERERIRTHGLQPALPAGEEKWEHFVDDPRSRIKGEPQGVYVYYTNDPWKHGQSHGSTMSDMDIWHVPYNQIKEIHEDPEGKWFGKGVLSPSWEKTVKRFYIPHPVQPELYLGSEAYEPNYDSQEMETHQHQRFWRRNTPEMGQDTSELPDEWQIGRPAKTAAVPWWQHQFDPDTLIGEFAPTDKIDPMRAAVPILRRWDGRIAEGLAEGRSEGRPIAPVMLNQELEKAMPGYDPWPITESWLEVNPQYDHPGYQGYEHRQQRQSKIARPVEEDFWQEHSPNMTYYHGTNPEFLQSIMTHGLHPWDSDLLGGRSSYSEWLEPRPGHTYITPEMETARILGSISSDPYHKPIILKIDAHHLDPKNINPDEDRLDSYHPEGPGFNKRIGPDPSLGEAAERAGFGNDPTHTQNEILQGKNIAYRGVIPPHAITPGYYHDGAWEPIDMASFDPDDFARGASELSYWGIEKKAKTAIWNPITFIRSLPAAIQQQVQQRIIDGLGMPSQEELDEMIREIGQIHSGNISDEDFPFMREGCGDYAEAMKAQYPHLKYGMNYNYVDEEEDPWDEESEGEQYLAPVHAFVHDGRFAYDATGRHPLPYNPFGADHTEYDVHPDDIAAAEFKQESGKETPEEHIVRRHPRLARPADPEWFEHRYDPNARVVKQLWHATPEEKAHSIMQQGIIPWDEGHGSPWEVADEDFLPRPGHVYLGENPITAHSLATNAYWMGGRKTPIVVFSVDPSYLDPKLVNPDEDAYHDHLKETVYPEKDMPYNNLGEMAEYHNLGQDPTQTHKGIIKQKTLAYKGVIPPEALTPYQFQRDEFGNVTVDEMSPKRKIMKALEPWQPNPEHIGHFNVDAPWWNCPRCHGAGCPDCQWTGEEMGPTDDMATEPSEDAKRHHNVEISNNEPGISTVNAKVTSSDVIQSRKT